MISLLTRVPFFSLHRSPWWLIRKGKYEHAARSLRRLGYNESDTESIVDEMKDTLERASLETEGATYLECFRKSNLRRTMISIAPLLIQSLAGSMFTNSYFTYYAQLAGFSTDMSYNLTIVQHVLSLVGNVCSWFLVDRIGRRRLMIAGTTSLCVALWLMAGLAVEGSTNSIRGAVSMILIFGFFYNVGIGAVAFTILTETSTSRLRLKTVAIGLALQNTFNLMWSFVLPYLFNPDHLNLGGKVGFIFGGTSIACLVYLWFCQPETRGRSYLELDEMFAQGIKARNFRSHRTTVDEEGEKLDGKTN